jgi:hypothetical protein
MPRFYSDDFPRFSYDAVSYEPSELPGAEIAGETLGQLLDSLFAQTGIRVVPNDPPKCFRYYPVGSDDFYAIDVHISRGDKEICPKQDLAFPLMAGDAVEAGSLPPC